MRARGMSENRVLEPASTLRRAEVQGLLTQIQGEHPTQALTQLSTGLTTPESAAQLFKSEASMLGVVRLMSSDEPKVADAAYQVLLVATKFPDAVLMLPNKDTVLNYLHAMQGADSKGHAQEIAKRIASCKPRQSNGRRTSDMRKRTKSQALQLLVPQGSDSEKTLSVLQQVTQHISNVKAQMLSDAERGRDALEAQLKDEGEHDNAFIAQLQQDNQSHGSEVADMIRDSLLRRQTKQMLGLERSLLDDADEEFNDMQEHFGRQIPSLSIGSEQARLLIDQITSLVRIEKLSMLDLLRGGARADLQDIEKIKNNILSKAQAQTVRVQNDVIQQAKARMKTLKLDYADELEFVLQSTPDFGDSGFALREKRDSRHEQIEARLLVPARLEWKHFSDSLLLDCSRQLEGEDGEDDTAARLTAQLASAEQNLEHKLGELREDCLEALDMVEEKCLAQDKMRRDQAAAKQTQKDLQRQRRKMEALQAHGKQELEAQRLKMERELLERDKQQHKEMMQLHERQLLSNHQRLQTELSQNVGALRFCCVVRMADYSVSATYNFTMDEAFRSRANQICRGIATKNLVKHPPPNSLRTKEGLFVHYKVTGDYIYLLEVITTKDVETTSAQEFLSEVETALMVDTRENDVVLISVCNRFVGPNALTPRTTDALHRTGSYNQMPPPATCLSCLQPTSPHDAIKSGKLVYHVDCFRCVVCNSGFSLEDAPKIKHGKPYHLSCYKASKEEDDIDIDFLTRTITSMSSASTSSTMSTHSSTRECNRCGDRIQQKCIKLDIRRWHEHCFLCTKCAKSLLSGFVLVGHNPYCAACGREQRIS